MAEEYKVPIKKLDQAGIEAKEGVKLTVSLNSGQTVEAKITKVAKDHVIIEANKPK